MKSTLSTKVADIANIKKYSSLSGSNVDEKNTKIARKKSCFCLSVGLVESSPQFPAVYKITGKLPPSCHEVLKQHNRKCRKTITALGFTGFTFHVYLLSKLSKEKFVLKSEHVGEKLLCSNLTCNKYVHQLIM